MSRLWAWTLLAVALAWLPMASAPLVQIVLQWLLKDGVSSDVALAALRDPAALESALVQTAVSALRSAGLTNLTNQSLALELRAFSAGMVGPTTPAPAQPESTPPRTGEVGVWVPVVVVGVAAVACLAVVVGVWVFHPPFPRLRRAPVLPHRIYIP